MLQKIESVSGNIVDIVSNEIYAATLEIKDNKIFKITRDNKNYNNFIIPGFVDSHIHIESSMLTPAEFARCTVKNGMVAVVADPHEIANVMGIDGIDFMIENGNNVPFKFYFAAPSCVPATVNETSGAILNSVQTSNLLKRPEIISLGEVMDIGAVINEDPEILAKIKAAKYNGKPIDGHAPGLSGEALKKYISAGISTDHECYRKDNAVEKIELGMKIQIREGSAAKDFDALSSLIEEFPNSCMFSSDDRHPNDLVKGHINLLVKRALSLGYDKMNVLKCASLNPIKHYNLDVGLLQEGDSADFVVIDDFENLNILKTVINGFVVFENGQSLMPQCKTQLINNFKAKEKNESDFKVEYRNEKIRVIGAKDGLLVTENLLLEPTVEDGMVISDIKRDILKIAVINRYEDSTPAVGFINGFGLTKGAIASSVAHDSHNIIVVGTSDYDITKAVNALIRTKGGLCVINDDKEFVLPLPIAGLMSEHGAFNVALKYDELEAEAVKIGSKLSDAFMTLSFMTLLVIPALKISDKGLFES